MQYEVWEEPNGDVTCTTPQEAARQRHNGLMSDQAKKTCEIVAPTWEDAMKQLHEKHGWEEYKPLLPLEKHMQKAATEGRHRMWKVSKNFVVEVQRDFFPEAWYTFFNIHLGSHNASFTLLGVELSLKWAGDHVGASLEAMSPWGHYWGVDLYDIRHEEDF